MGWYFFFLMAPGYNNLSQGKNDNWIFWRCFVIIAKPSADTNFIVCCHNPDLDGHTTMVFSFFQSKTFLETKSIWTSFLTVELCHMLSLLFIYVGGSCIFNSCTIHTDLFPTVTDLAQLVLRLMVPACLISSSSKLWGKGFDPEPLDMGEASTIRKHTTPWCKYHLHTMTVQ